VQIIDRKYCPGTDGYVGNVPRDCLYGVQRRTRAQRDLDDAQSAAQQRSSQVRRERGRPRSLRPA